MDVLTTNIIISVAAILLLWLPAARVRRKLSEARTRLADTTVEQGIQEKFDLVLKSSAQQAYTSFWLGLVGFFVVLLVGSQVYASAVEPDAVVGQWIFLYLLFFGVALIAVAIGLSALIAACWQSYRAAKLLHGYVTNHPTSSVLREAYEIIVPRAGEIGVSVTAIVAVVICTLYGLVLIALFYMATQTAIECARNSKCM